MIKQGKSQVERMKSLHELVVRQIQTLSTLDTRRLLQIQNKNETCAIQDG